MNSVRNYDVRLGNYVSYKNQEYRIHGISRDYPFLDTSEFDAGAIEWKDLEAISLNSRYLELFGFKRGNFKYFKGTFVIDVSVQKSKKHGGYFFNGIRVTSVHQLQNIYHAYTGSELW